jgi:hypothetical protein
VVVRNCDSEQNDNFILFKFAFFIYIYIWHIRCMHNVVLISLECSWCRVFGFNFLSF